MKTYLINLDRSKDRLAWFTEQAAALDLDVVRVSAVEGASISASDRLSYDLISFDQRVLSPNELGCLLSHLEAWRRIVSAGDRWSFVAEDDIHFGTNVSQYLSSPDWIPDGIDIVKAETFLYPVTLSSMTQDAPDGRKLRALQSFHCGAAGYFISRHAAQALLAFAQTHCEPADHVIFWPAGTVQHGLRIVQLDPAICIQDSLLHNANQRIGFEGTIVEETRFYYSDTRQNDESSRKLSGVSRVRREIKRIGSQLTALLRRILPAQLGGTVRKSVAFR